MKRCYFQGCQEPAVIKEHIPPKAFFPEGKRTNLLTVGSCTAHNNQKSGDDLYVLAHICVNTSPANESRDIFRDTGLPQLGYNEDKLGKMIVKDAVRLPGGPTAYRVDIARFERFFSALACGIVYKAAKQSLPAHHAIRHIFHDLIDEAPTAEQTAFYRQLADFYRIYSKEAGMSLDFGQVNTANTTVYSAMLLGVPDFNSSITVAHYFVGRFRVTSRLSLRFEDQE